MASLPWQPSVVVSGGFFNAKWADRDDVIGLLKSAPGSGHYLDNDMAFGYSNSLKIVESLGIFQMRAALAFLAGLTSTRIRTGLPPETLLPAQHR